MTSVEVIIFPADVMQTEWLGKSGFCMSGCRAWAAQHGFSWPEFVRHGVAAERLLATGDPMAAAVVAQAVARRANQET